MAGSPVPGHVPRSSRRSLFRLGCGGMCPAPRDVEKGERGVHQVDRYPREQ
jgi:hypothetical protein